MGLSFVVRPWKKNKRSLHSKGHLLPVLHSELLSALSSGRAALVAELATWSQSVKCQELFCLIFLRLLSNGFPLN